MSGRSSMARNLVYRMISLAWRRRIGRARHPSRDPPQVVRVASAGGPAGRRGDRGPVRYLPALCALTLTPKHRNANDAKPPQRRPFPFAFRGARYRIRKKSMARNVAPVYVSKRGVILRSGRPPDRNFVFTRAQRPHARRVAAAYGDGSRRPGQPKTHTPHWVSNCTLSPLHGLGGCSSRNHTAHRNHFTLL